jgi:arginyl-tRNA synthetase
MNFFRHFRDQVEEAVDSLSASGVLPTGLDVAKVTLEPPRDASHGDISTNAAMVLAKPAAMKPRDIADRLAPILQADARVATADVAGPGFINLRLAPSFWHGQLAEILDAGPDYGRSDIGVGEKVNVEYVSANPTGPLHVGHGRGAVFGDALANLLGKAGFDVTREYYINDAGAQIDALARSVHFRYREILGEAAGAMPDGLYPGAYVKDMAEALAERDGDQWRSQPESAWLAPIRGFSTDYLMDVIRADLKAVGIDQAVFTSELALHQAGGIDQAVAALTDRNLLYTGVLDPPKGKKPEDWEPRPQLLFRATQFGDDVDRPLKKSDGSWTYFAADIAYHNDKYRRGFATMIDVWGADHSGYVKRMKAATKAVTEGAGALDIKICQLVTFLDGGEPVRMSKRAGTFVSLREVVEHKGIGKDIFRFIMLTRKNDAPLEFDFAKVTEQSKDNAVFYVQYAHARAKSVFRNAGREIPGLAMDRDALKAAPLDRLDGEAELALIKFLANWPRIVETAAAAHEPHRVAFYLYDLAGAFHGLWTKGRDTGLRFIVADDPSLTLARLALVEAVAIVVASGLAIIGVEPLDELRS